MQHKTVLLWICIVFAIFCGHDILSQEEISILDTTLLEFSFLDAISYIDWQQITSTSFEKTVENSGIFGWLILLLIPISVLVFVISCVRQKGAMVLTHFIIISIVLLLGFLGVYVFGYLEIYDLLSSMSAPAMEDDFRYASTLMAIPGLFASVVVALNIFLVAIELFFAGKKTEK